MAEGFEDQVALAAGKGDEAERDAITVENCVGDFGFRHGIVEALGEAPGFGAHDLSCQLVAFGRSRDLVTYILQGDGNDLVGQGPVQRRELVETEK